MDDRKCAVPTMSCKCLLMLSLLLGDHALESQKGLFASVLPCLDRRPVALILAIPVPGQFYRHLFSETLTARDNL